LYNIKVPEYILNEMEELGLDPHREINHVLAKGLRLLERALEAPPENKWQLYAYDERKGHQKPWDGVTRHKMKTFNFEAGFKLMTRVASMVVICRNRKIDNRMLYYQALIEPYLPKHMDKREIKQQMQSNQLMPKQPATIVSLCLWSHALRHKALHKDQNRLEVA
jgi:hypothetical protein